MDPLPSERLRSLGLSLPPSPEPKGSYAAVVCDDARVHVSGQIPLEQGQVVSPGRVDSEVSVALAQQLAHRATLQGLAAAAATVGSIDRIERALRVAVYVASSDDFHRQHEVGNGATDLLIELFGAESRPVRVSLGATRLPLNAAVEVELLLRART